MAAVVLDNDESGDGEGDEDDIKWVSILIGTERKEWQLSKKRYVTRCVPLLTLVARSENSSAIMVGVAEFTWGFCQSAGSSQGWTS